MSSPEQSFWCETDKGLFITLYVQPRASKNQICGVQEGALKVRLTSPPVDGAANKLCREFIAGLLRLSKSSIEIVSGETSRQKRLRIITEDIERVRSILDGLTA